MSSNLLALSFHKPGWNLREDAFFKKHSLAGSLLTGDSLGDSFPPALAAQPGKDATGLTAKAYGGTTQITLLDIGLPAWQRDAFKSSASARSEFEKWIGPKIETECGCLLLCGHHAMARADQPIVWGRQGTDRVFTGLLPGKAQDGKPILEFWGSPGTVAQGIVRRAGPFDFNNTLKNCRVILIIGCTGIGYKDNTSSVAGRYWQNWVALASGKKPIILGWYGAIGAPKDQYAAETFSEPFWDGMVTLAQSTGTDLKTLCETHPEDVIGLWGKVLKKIYRPSKKQSFLWYGLTQGAGAIDPNGGLWRVRNRNGDIEKV